MTANLTIDWEGRMGKYWLALGNGVRSNPIETTRSVQTGLMYNIFPSGPTQLSEVKKCFIRTSFIELYLGGKL